jgi:hypothetical protein
MPVSTSAACAHGRRCKNAQKPPIAGAARKISRDGQLLPPAFAVFFGNAVGFLARHAAELE